MQNKNLFEKASNLLSKYSYKATILISGLFFSCTLLFFVKAYKKLEKSQPNEVLLESNGLDSETFSPSSTPTSDLSGPTPEVLLTKKKEDSKFLSPAPNSSPLLRIENPDFKLEEVILEKVTIEPIEEILVSDTQAPQTKRSQNGRKPRKTVFKKPSWKL